MDYGEKRDKEFVADMRSALPPKQAIVVPVPWGIETPSSGKHFFFFAYTGSDTSCADVSANLLAHELWFHAYMRKRSEEPDIFLATQRRAAIRLETSL